MWHLSNIKKKITIICPSKVPTFSHKKYCSFGVFTMFLTLQLTNNIIVWSCVLICLYMFLFFEEWWIWIWDMVKTATFFRRKGLCILEDLGGLFGYLPHGFGLCNASSKSKLCVSSVTASFPSNIPQHAFRGRWVWELSINNVWFFCNIFVDRIM